MFKKTRKHLNLSTIVCVRRSKSLQKIKKTDQTCTNYQKNVTKMNVISPLKKWLKIKNCQTKQSKNIKWSTIVFVSVKRYENKEPLNNHKDRIFRLCVYIIMWIEKRIYTNIFQVQVVLKIGIFYQKFQFFLETFCPRKSQNAVQIATIRLSMNYSVRESRK